MPFICSGNNWPDIETLNEIPTHSISDQKQRCIMDTELERLRRAYLSEKSDYSREQYLTGLKRAGFWFEAYSTSRYYTKDMESWLLDHYEGVDAKVFRALFGDTFPSPCAGYLYITQESLPSNRKDNSFCYVIDTGKESCRWYLRLEEREFFGEDLKFLERKLFDFLGVHPD